MTENLLPVDWEEVLLCDHFLRTTFSAGRGRCEEASPIFLAFDVHPPYASCLKVAGKAKYPDYSQSKLNHLFNMVK